MDEENNTTCTSGAIPDLILCTHMKSYVYQCWISGQTKHTYACMYQSRSVTRVEPIVALTGASAQKQECCARRYQTLSSDHLPQSASHCSLHPKWVCHIIQVTENKPLGSPNKPGKLGDPHIPLQALQLECSKIIFTSVSFKRSVKIQTNSVMQPFLDETTLFWRSVSLNDRVIQFLDIASETHTAL